MEDLANRIRELLWNYDTYEYGDMFTDDMEAIKHIEDLLQDKKGIDSLITFLDEVMESEDQKQVKEAEEIKQQLIEMN